MRLNKPLKILLGLCFVPTASPLCLNSLLSRSNFLSASLKELEAVISERLAALDSPITTITGIGDTLGAAILSEIGDINRFETPDKLAAFAGIDQTVKQSGLFTGTQSRMSKRGSPYLRRAIWLAATPPSFMILL
jgi:transposase